MHLGVSCVPLPLSPKFHFPFLIPITRIKMILLEEHYEKICQVGQGTYGQVFKARPLNTASKDTPKFYALKKIRAEAEKEGVHYSSFLSLMHVVPGDCSEGDNVVAEIRASEYY